MPTPVNDARQPMLNEELEEYLNKVLEMIHRIYLSAPCDSMCVSIPEFIQCKDNLNNDEWRSMNIFGGIYFVHPNEYKIYTDIGVFNLGYQFFQDLDQTDMIYFDMISFRNNFFFHDTIDFFDNSTGQEESMSVYKYRESNNDFLRNNPSLSSEIIATLWVHVLYQNGIYDTDSYEKYLHNLAIST